MSDTNDADTHKLIFTGCCNLSDGEVSKLYNLDLLTDDELASVGLERESVIDDYRHLHEVSQMRKLESQPTLARGCYPSKLQRPKLKAAWKPTRSFNYDLLNKFFRCMQSESVEFCSFMEREFHVIADFHRKSKILLLPSKEREFARYESFFEDLDIMYQNGEQNRVISIVANVMIHFHRDPNPVKLLPGYGSHYARGTVRMSTF